MKTDLHNHTTRCNHATGTMEAYLDEAIKQGISIYGFSDHAPMAFDPKYRMGFEQMADYEAQIDTLASHYKDKLTLLKAYEVDWLLGAMDERVLHSDVDYLIGSVHFLGEWGFDNPEFIGEYEQRDINGVWEEYFQAVTAMAESGYFNIAGHLDLIKVFRFMPTQDLTPSIDKTLDAIKDNRMALEINAAGLRKPIKELYPSLPILKRAFKKEIPITFASDAHAIAQVGAGLDEAMAVAKSVGYGQCAVFHKREMELIKF